MLSEFKEFLLKANVLALALAFIVGVALAAVVNSLVKDILMPPVGMLLGGVDFNNLYINLSSGSYPNLKAAQEAGAATINYGVFINNVIAFLIVAFAVFLVVQAYGRMRTTEEPAAAPPRKDCPFCAEPVALAATRCPHCTSELAPLRPVAV